MNQPRYITQAIRVCMGVVLTGSRSNKDAGASPYVCAMNLINWTMGKSYVMPLSNFLSANDMAEWICAETDRKRCALALRIHSTHKGKPDEVQAEHQS